MNYRLNVGNISFVFLLLNSTRGEAGRILLIENNIMKSALTNCSTAAWKPLALASALAAFISPALAQTQTDQRLEPVTVSASRFASVPEFAPIGATVITAEQIREAGISSANEAIRKLGGVYGRQNLYGTSDFSLDLQGFGATSDQNVVILVDGIRISENEGVPALTSSIPIESIERIEIVRGGSSVLYGEGATSGTIQIITKKGLTGATRGSVVAAIGSHNLQEIRASLSKGWERFSIDANIGKLDTDNYRDNNKLQQENFSGGMQWKFADGRIGVRVDAARQDSGLPGGLTLAEYQQNPRQTKDPSNHGSIDSNRYTVFAEQRVGNLELAADLSYRDRLSKSLYAGRPESTYDGGGTQFSPRIRYLSGTGDIRNELVVGMDFSDYSRRLTKDGAVGADRTSQQSKAIYVKDEIRIGKARFAAGARHEKFDQDASGSDIYDQSFSVNALDLQGSYEITPLVNLFAKAGRSYRVANIDDNGFTSNNEPLNPQRSNDLELGASFDNKAQKLTAKIFKHKLKDEIYYDPTVPPCFFGFCGANVNLDPTRHQGISIEASTLIAKSFSLSAVLQHVSSKFTDGPYSGRELTLIPKNTATMRLNWMPGNGQSADVGVQWADSQRYSADFSNACNNRMPSYTTVDARYAVRKGLWEFAVSGTNLTDKDYFSQAYGECGSDPSLSIYPDPGRSIRLSVRRDF